MLRNVTKILLGIYAILLIIILFTFSEGLGFPLLLITGIFTLITLIVLTNDLKKLKNSLKSRIFSVVLVNIILYSLAMLFYGLGNIGVGDKGLLYAFTAIFYLVLFILSLIITIILTVINKEQTIQGKPNKILLTIAIIVLAILFYSAAINALANITNASGICSLNIEIKENSFIFKKGMARSCIMGIAVETDQTSICQEGDDRCIESVAINNLDLSKCNEIQGSAANCIQGYEIRLLNTDERMKQGIEPEISPTVCDVLDKKENKDICLRAFAFDLNDVSFCIYGNLFENCYDQLANVENNGDESQCDALKSPAKEHCISYVNSITLEPSSISIQTP